MSGPKKLYAVELTDSCLHCLIGRFINELVDKGLTDYGKAGDALMEVLAEIVECDTNVSDQERDNLREITKKRLSAHFDAAREKFREKDPINQPVAGHA